MVTFLLGAWYYILLVLHRVGAVGWPRAGGEAAGAARVAAVGGGGAAESTSRQQEEMGAEYVGGPGGWTRGAKQLEVASSGTPNSLQCFGYELGLPALFLPAGGWLWGGARIYFFLFTLSALKKVSWGARLESLLVWLDRVSYS